MAGRVGLASTGPTFTTARHTLSPYEVDAQLACGAAPRVLMFTRKASRVLAAVEVAALGPRRGLSGVGRGASGAPTQGAKNPCACYDVHHAAAAASGRRELPSALPGRGRPPSAVDAWVRSAGTLLSVGAGVGASRGCGARHPRP